MGEKKTISESEEIVLEIIEENYPVTMKQIVEQVSQKREWSDSTIKTFVRRLVKKGMIKEEKHNVIYFSPTQSKNQRQLSILQEIIDKFYGSSYKLAALNLVENHKITKKELQEIIDYLKEE